MTVGEKIREVRISRNMSQEELAYKMGYKDRSSITKIEKSSDKKIPMDTVQKAADALRCSPLYLMGWTKFENGETEVSIESEINLAKLKERQRTRLMHFAQLFLQLPESEQTVVEKLLKSLTDDK